MSNLIKWWNDLTDSLGCAMTAEETREFVRKEMENRTKCTSREKVEKAVKIFCNWIRNSRDN